MWNLLCSLMGKNSLPWIIGGDFNEITLLSEKEGGLRRRSRQMDDFVKALRDYGVGDMRFFGPRFMWEGNRHGHHVKERLDRYVATNAWFSCFPKSRVIHIYTRMNLTICLFYWK